MESLDLRESDAHWGHEHAGNPTVDLQGLTNVFMESPDLQNWTRIGTMSRIPLTQPLPLSACDAQAGQVGRGDGISVWTRDLDNSSPPLRGRGQM
jgi:hypothetical protein